MLAHACLAATKQVSLPRSLAMTGGSSAATPVRQSVSGSGQIKCNQEMMTSYGLTGVDVAANLPHKYCPMITSNCCTANDAEVSMTIWKTEFQPKVERYYEVYLYSIKYILGFSTQFDLLANDYLKTDNGQCKTVAQDYKKMNVSPKVTQDVFNAFVLSLQKMGDVRRGFYCIMCDGRTQKELADYLAIVNLFYSDRIYFSKEFCKKLVDNTIRASYFTVYYLKRFAENGAALMNCKSGNTTQVEFDVDFWTTQQVKNCYYFKNKYFFFFCERYCEKFHLVKPSDILDGNVKELKKFVGHIMQYRKQVFYYPSDNILMDGVTYEEDYLEEYFDQILAEKVLIRASTSNVELDKFETDIVYSGGMDPLGSIDNCAYPLILASQSALGLCLAVLLAFLS